MNRPTTRQYKSEDLIRAGVKVTQDVLRQIVDDIAIDPNNAFTRVEIGEPPKKALRVDIGAEDTFARALHRYQQHNFSGINVYGEERLRDANLDLTSEQNTCVLVDALDGTDLLERGIGNWCSASVFFCPANPPGEQIRAAVVGLPTGEVYYASADLQDAWVREGDNIRVVKGCSGVKSLRRASICYYGQKLTNYMSLYTSGAARKLSKHLNSKAGHSDFRIYNLAGIPMMLRLIDKRCSGAHGIDAVLDIEGQKPHDVVAGAYIALQGGAVLKDAGTGTNLTLGQLEQKLLKPASQTHELKYVMAATEELCDGILNMLRSAEHA